MVTIYLLVLLIIYKTPVAISMDNNKEVHQNLYGRHQGKLWYFHSTVIFPEEEYNNNIGVHEDQPGFSQVLKVVFKKLKTSKLMPNIIDPSLKENKLMVRLQVLYVKGDKQFINNQLQNIVSPLTARLSVDSDINASLPDVKFAGHINKISSNDLNIYSDFRGLTADTNLQSGTENTISSYNKLSTSGLDAGDFFERYFDIFITKYVKKQNGQTTGTNNMKKLTKLEYNKARKIHSKQINSNADTNNENQRKSVNTNLEKLSDVELNSKLQFINKKLKKRDVNKQKSLIDDLTMSARSSEEKVNIRDKLFRSDVLTIGNPLPPVDLDLGVHTE